ncbi:MAG: dipeptidase [Gemmatimonadales bacterium]
MADTISERARAVHQRAMVWDAHCDSIQRVVVDDVDLGVSGNGQCDLPAWKAGGVKAQVFAVWVDTIYAPDQAARRAFEQIAAFHRFLARYPDQVGLALTGADVRRLASEGKLAAMLALEGGLAIQNELGLLASYARLGATSMTLTHSASLDWVDSSTDVARSNGLSAFGREVIAELNRLRMIVDLSHVSDAVIEQVTALSTAPVIASHSSAKALCSHPRNLTDRLARAIADTGGVVGVNFVNEIIDQASHDRNAGGGVLHQLNQPTEYRTDELDRVAAERIRGFFMDQTHRPPFERIIEHILHLVNVAGADHVGLGADMDACRIPLPEGFDGARDYPKITEALCRHGLSDDQIEKILGGNFLRVFEAVRGG